MLIWGKGALQLLLYCVVTYLCLGTLDRFRSKLTFTSEENMPTIPRTPTKDKPTTARHPTRRRTQNVQDAPQNDEYGRNDHLQLNGSQSHVEGDSDEEGRAERNSVLDGSFMSSFLPGGEPNPTHPALVPPQNPTLTEMPTLPEISALPKNVSLTHSEDPPPNASHPENETPEVDASPKKPKRRKTPKERKTVTFAGSSNKDKESYKWGAFGSNRPIHLRSILKKGPVEPAKTQNPKIYRDKSERNRGKGDRNRDENALGDLAQLTPKGPWAGGGRSEQMEVARAPKNDEVRALTDTEIRLLELLKEAAETSPGVRSTLNSDPVFASLLWGGCEKQADPPINEEKEVMLASMPKKKKEEKWPKSGIDLPRIEEGGLMGYLQSTVFEDIEDETLPKGLKKVEREVANMWAHKGPHQFFKKRNMFAKASASFTIDVLKGINRFAKGVRDEGRKEALLVMRDYLLKALTYDFYARVSSQRQMMEAYHRCRQEFETIDNGDLGTLAESTLPHVETHEMAEAMAMINRFGRSQRSAFGGGGSQVNGSYHRNYSNHRPNPNYKGNWKYGGNRNFYGGNGMSYGGGRRYFEGSQFGAEQNDVERYVRDEREGRIRSRGEARRIGANYGRFEASSGFRGGNRRRNYRGRNRRGSQRQRQSQPDRRQ